MSAQPLTFPDMSLPGTLRRYAAQRRARGKDSQDTMRKVMKEWLYQAYAHTDGKTSPDRGRIRAYLMGMSRKYQAVKKAGKRRSSKVADEMRGTIALAIVMALNYKGVREAAPRGGWKTDAPYRVARRFLNMRLYSSGMHRAGFREGFRLVKGGAAVSGPRYRVPFGSADEKLAGDLAEIVIENFAQSKDGGGMKEVDPGAFDDTAAAVNARFLAFVIHDEAALAAKHRIPITFT